MTLSFEFVGLDSNWPEPWQKSLLTEQSISSRKTKSYWLWKNTLTSNPSGPPPGGFYLECFWFYPILYLFNCLHFALSIHLPLNDFSPHQLLLLSLPHPSSIRWPFSLICPASPSLISLSSSWHLSALHVFIFMHSPHSGCPGPWPCAHQCQLHSWWLHAACPRCGTANTNTWRIKPRFTGIYLFNHEPIVLWRCIVSSKCGACEIEMYCRIWKIPLSYISVTQSESI